MRTRILTAAVLLGLAGPARLGAIELSLEENRAERGNIGFVDSQRLFKLFPETLKAKENFDEAVRQAEDQINLRQAEVLRLRAAIDSLQVERAALVKSTPTPVAATPAAAAVPVAAPAPAVSTAAAALAAVRVSTTATVPVALSTAPAVAPAVPGTSAAVSTRTVMMHLPGFPETPPQALAETKATLPPGNQPAPPAAVTAPPAAASTAPAPVAPPAAPTAAPATSSAPASAVLTAALAALDSQIAQKTRELERKQREAQDEQSSAEKNLLDLESRKSEILLGKIYKAVQEVARREGVSVVVDKSGILYGHNAVDLTDKVLKYLKGG